MPFVFIKHVFNHLVEILITTFFLLWLQVFDVLRLEVLIQSQEKLMSFLEIITPLKEFAIVVSNPLIEHDILIIDLGEVYLYRVFHLLSIQEHLSRQSNEEYLHF